MRIPGREEPDGTCRSNECMETGSEREPSARRCGCRELRAAVAGSSVGGIAREREPVDPRRRTAGTGLAVRLLAVVGGPGSGAGDHLSWDRTTVDASGTCGNTRRRGQSCCAFDQHRVGQIAGVSTPHSHDTVRRCPGNRAVPGSHQGPRCRSAAHHDLDHRRVAFGIRRTRRGIPQRVRRRHADRDSPVGPCQRAMDLHQSRHAASRHPRLARAVVALPPQPPLRGGRRMPLLPWRFRIQCRVGTTPVATPVRTVRSIAGIRSRQCDDLRTGAGRKSPHRSAVRGSHRRRIPTRSPHRRPMGTAAAQRDHRRKRSSGKEIRRR